MRFDRFFYYSKKEFKFTFEKESEIIDYNELFFSNSSI